MKCLVNDIIKLCMKNFQICDDALSHRFGRLPSRPTLILDHSLLNEKGTLQKLIKDIVVENVHVGSEDEELFRKDFKRYMVIDGESKRKVALDLFRCIVSKKDAKVRALSRSLVYKLINRSTRKLREKDCWSSWKWREKECGFWLATCLVELDDCLDVETLVQDYTTPVLLLVNINKAPMVRASVLNLLLVAFRSGRISVSWEWVSVLGKFRWSQNIILFWLSISVKNLFFGCILISVKLSIISLYLPWFSGETIDRKVHKQCKQSW